MKIDSILILAAGKGTRLRPYTDNLPKSLLPLGETNILRNLILQSKKYFEEARIYVNASYLVEKIIEEIANFPLEIRPRIIWEQIPLGPAFTVTNHCNNTKENVLVLHGDNFFTDLTYSEFAKSIKQNDQNVSILLCHQRTKKEARSQVIERNSIVQSISESSISGLNVATDANIDPALVWSSSGAIVIKRQSLLNFIPERGAALSPNLINYIASQEELFLEKCLGARVSIDNEKSYLEAVQLSNESQKLFDRSL
jgi:NDP-sugar pyrophosphorylase family protein